MQWFQMPDDQLQSERHIEEDGKLYCGCGLGFLPHGVASSQRTILYGGGGEEE